MLPPPRKFRLLGITSHLRTLHKSRQCPSAAAAVVRRRDGSLLHREGSPQAEAGLRLLRERTGTASSGEQRRTCSPAMRRGASQPILPSCRTGWARF